MLFFLTSFLDRVDTVKQADYLPVEQVNIYSYLLVSYLFKKPQSAILSQTFYVGYVN